MALLPVHDRPVFWQVWNRPQYRCPLLMLPHYLGNSPSWNSKRRFDSLRLTQDWDKTCSHGCSGFSSPFSPCQGKFMPGMAVISTTGGASVLGIFEITVTVISIIWRCGDTCIELTDSCNCGGQSFSHQENSWCCHSLGSCRYIPSKIAPSEDLSVFLRLLTPS